MPKYRDNVAAIILNREGEILICERKNNARAWQFPQGGVDKGESFIEALHREVWEEVGLESKYYKVIDQKDGYKYLYPPKVRQKKKHDGQKQTYFLCKLKKSAPEVDLGDNNPEFSDYDWVRPEEFDEEWLPDFKLDVYRQVMRDFFGTEIVSV
ncbi:RNA pyrophosphohydrolase [Rubritalea tangerina]|uniref:RNA pyrophosphohydrolase n=1 Tax=Rubritalea tangerina TaxID=430798 RepID=A0ABW4ZCT1_9BACT